MKNIFKTFGYWLSFPFVFVIILLKLLRVKRKAKKYKKDPNSVFLQDRLKIMYKLFRKFIYLKRVKIEVEGIEKLPSKQMLFVANHKGILDPMVIFVALYEAEKLGPTSFICKYELSEKWITRCCIELMDGIFIKRNDGRSIYQCYLKEMENMKQGFSIIVFPEGTRIRGDQFGAFKDATLKVAYQNFVAITPIALYGTDKKRKLFHDLPIKVAFLRTIQPNNFITVKQLNLMNTIQDDVFVKYNELKAKASRGE